MGTPEGAPLDAEHGERALDGSDHATDTNGALRSLARAARSFLIYDPHNEAIRAFLRDYQAHMRRALAHGAMELEVRPFELVLATDMGQETVYVQRDRERSLAFRLYRDGVRRLIVQHDAEWTELLRLLEILSIRYTGVRQHEDDIVTLLWKAGFQHIEVVAVEGFVLAGGNDEDEEVGAGRDNVVGAELRRAGPKVGVPPDWDRPIPDHPPGDPRQLTFRPISSPQKHSLHEEVSSRAVGVLAVRLCTDMLDLVRDPTDPTTLPDAAGLVEEVRTLLLADGQLSALLNLAQAVHDLRANDPDASEAALRQFVNTRALSRVLHSAARSDGALPVELAALLDLAPGDHLPAIVGAMASERAVGSRALARKLVAREVARNPQSVISLINTVEPEIGADLLHAVGEVSPATVVGVISRIITTEEPELQSKICRLVRDLEPDILDAEQLVEWLVTPELATRLAIIERIGTRGVPAHYTVLKRHLDTLSARQHDEAIALGIAMAHVSPDRALDELGHWVRPRSLLKRMQGAAHTGSRAWAGISGLGVLPGEYPELAIRWRMERSSEELRTHGQRTLFERRQSGARGDKARPTEVDVFYHRGLLTHPGKLVLTSDMLCFAPTHAFTGWFGGGAIDVPIRTLKRVVVNDKKQLIVEGQDTTWTFSGSELEPLGEQLKRVFATTRAAQR